MDASSCARGRVILTAAERRAGSLAVPRSGLRGHYYTNLTRSGTPIAVAIDQSLSTDTLDNGTAGVWPSYSVEWTGYLVIDAAGIYEFCDVSDDGSELEVADQIVVQQRRPARPAGSARRHRPAAQACIRFAALRAGRRRLCAGRAISAGKASGWRRCQPRAVAGRDARTPDLSAAKPDAAGGRDRRDVAVIAVGVARADSARSRRRGCRQPIAARSIGPAVAIAIVDRRRASPFAS